MYNYVINPTQRKHVQNKWKNENLNNFSKNEKNKPKFLTILCPAFLHQRINAVGWT